MRSKTYQFVFLVTYQFGRYAPGVIPTETKTRVAELLRTGWTQPAIAAELALPLRTVRYLAETLGEIAQSPDRVRGGRRRRDGSPPAPKPLPAPTPKPRPVAGPPPIAPADGVDALALVRSLLADARRDYSKAAGSFDAGNATKFARIAAQLTPVLARLEKATQEDGDVIRLPRDQIEAKRRELREILRKLTSDAPRCADCGREIRASWGEQ